MAKARNKESARRSVEPSETARPKKPGSAHNWWLLIHQLPHKPDYFRIKIGRRLQKLGAVGLKNSVYALPHSESTHEDLQWLLREIQEGGGEAHLCEARFTDGISDAEIENLFRQARDADFQALIEEADAIARELGARGGASDDLRKRAEKDLARLRARFDEVVAIDFFAASGRKPVLAALEQLQGQLEGKGAAAAKPATFDSPAAYRGKVWVTRQGVKVDRIACAWLIKRFVDPKARFHFVEGKSHQPGRNEVRFDMFEGEFTHEGDRCSFETFVHRLRLADRGLTPIAEIVHDIDIKDGKFGREEAKGVALLLDTIVTLHARDEERIERGTALFNDLYEHFRRKPT